MGWQDLGYVSTGKQEFEVGLCGSTNNVTCESRGVSSSCPWEDDEAVRYTSDILKARSRQIMWGKRGSN